MSRGPDAATQLERALVRAGRVAGIDVAVVGGDWTRWASATFTGARHRLQLRAVASPMLDRWLAGLPEHEFALRGQLVADLVVVSATQADERVAVELEALTVEEQ